MLLPLISKTSLYHLVSQLLGLQLMIIFIISLQVIFLINYMSENGKNVNGHQKFLGSKRTISNVLFCLTVKNHHTRKKNSKYSHFKSWNHWIYKTKSLQPMCEAVGVCGALGWMINAWSNHGYSSLNCTKNRITTQSWPHVIASKDNLSVLWILSVLRQF